MAIDLGLEHFEIDRDENAAKNLFRSGLAREKGATGSFGESVDGARRPPRNGKRGIDAFAKSVQTANVAWKNNEEEEP